jgi:hypothetical protein
MADTSCPISADTWESACWSAWSAVSAADAVCPARLELRALPPAGPPCLRDVAGGFCFSTIPPSPPSALRRAARVAIIDVDLHHGNGTQGVFYERNDVLTVSIHADPVRFYPFFWGHADERGEGLGLGYNLNLPLPRKSGDEASSPRSTQRSAASRPSRPTRSSWRSASTPSRATRSAASPSRRRALPASARRSQAQAADGHRAGGRLSLRRTRRQPDLVPGDKTISVSAELGEATYGICSTKFLYRAFRTTNFKLEITFAW